MKKLMASLSTLRLSCLAGAILGLSMAQVRSADSPLHFQPASDEFDALGRAVIELLHSRDALPFATNLAVSANDWHSLITTNLTADDLERLNSFAQRAGQNAHQLESGAKAFLSRAEALQLDFSKGNWHFRVVTPKSTRSIHFSAGPAGRLALPYLRKLEVVLTPEANANSSNLGDFRMILLEPEKFPTGWRIAGLQWTGFPTNVADEKTRQELVILEKAVSHEGLTREDDPALLKLGEALVRFIRERDTRAFEKDVLLNADLVWPMMQKAGQGGPSREQVEEEVSLQAKEQVKFARAAAKVMEDAGVDLKNAEIKIESAGVERSQLPGRTGSLDEGLMGSQFKLALSVRSEGKGRNGTSLSGEYVLAAREILRIGGQWRICQEVHWEKLPEGLTDSKAASRLEFENYVAEHGTLPPQTVAPEVEFTTLEGEKKMKLSELRGKVVILDFWATWCGPCQGPMAELQQLRRGHAEWQDKVAIIPVSIDDTLAIVKKHVEKRGWTNTFNVWAGTGGWRSTPAAAYRVTGVPTSYIIDPQGRIVWAGHPAGAALAETVARLLKANKAAP
jgi:thiol-disulfide isomerase/thioredoxin